MVFSQLEMVIICRSISCVFVMIRVMRNEVISIRKTLSSLVVTWSHNDLEPEYLYECQHLLVRMDFVLNLLDGFRDTFISFLEQVLPDGLYKKVAIKFKGDFCNG